MARGGDHGTRTAPMRLTRVLLAPMLIFVLAAAAALNQARAGADHIADATARYLAGLTPAAASPFEALSQEAHWDDHAVALDGMLQRIETQTLAEVRAWSRQNVPAKPRITLYPFSGPDFLFAEAFNNSSETYVLAGLEPVGTTPEPRRLVRSQRRDALRELRHAMRAVLEFGFFRTADMKEELGVSRYSGVLPILLVFATRANYYVKSVEHVWLSREASIEERIPSASGRRNSTDRRSVPGVRITLLDTEDGTVVPVRTLYYFQTDLSDNGLRNSGFAKFARGLGESFVLVKSASYLMHLKSFTSIKDLLLDSGRVIAQDDSGIPLRHFKEAAWSITPYGTYIGPIDKFPKHAPQPDMRKLFRSDRVRPLDFGIGYRWRAQQSNLLLAIKKQADVPTD